MKAVKSVWPDTIISGCYFHFRQCQWKHIVNTGLSVLYNSDIDFENKMKMFGALTFVPVEHVLEAYDFLLQND